MSARLKLPSSSPSYLYSLQNYIRIFFTSLHLLNPPPVICLVNFTNLYPVSNKQPARKTFEALRWNPSTLCGLLSSALRNEIRECISPGLVARRKSFYEARLTGKLSDDRNLVQPGFTTLSLGLETLGGEVTKILPINHKLPASQSETFSTVTDDQTMVQINVIRGERVFAKDNKSLGRFTLDGIPPAPKGEPQIEVTFDIDANGVLSVIAELKGTGKKQHFTISGATALPTDEEWH